MERINLTKYGLKRAKELDFSDDGTRFTAYTLGNLRITKAVEDGTAYISARMLDESLLPYEISRELPGYKGMCNLNICNIASLTDKDLEDFVDSCKIYEAAYLATVASIKYPTRDEIAEQATKIYKLRKEEYETCAKLLSENIDIFVELDRYSLNRAQGCLKSLKAAVDRDIETTVEHYYKTGFSFSYVKPTNSDLNESYDSRCFKSIFKYNAK